MENGRAIGTAKNAMANSGKTPGKCILGFQSVSRQRFHCSTELDPQLPQNVYMYRSQSVMTPPGVDGVFVGHATCRARSGVHCSGAQCRRLGL